MRGKYKNRAENRAAERTIEERAAEQERLIAKLRSENVALTEKNQAEAAAHTREMTRLRSDLQTAVSPELKARKEQIAEILDQLGKLRDENRVESAKFKRICVWATDTFVAQGLTHVEALERIASIATGEPVWAADNKDDAVRIGAAGVQAVQRARGMRH